MEQVTQPAEGQTDGQETPFDDRRKGNAMLILIAKFLAIFSLPVLAAILWKIRSRAAWACAIAALAAIAIYSFVRIPLGDFVLNTSLFFPDGFPNPSQITVHSVAVAFVFGTVRESIQWLIMRLKVTKLRAWQDGVLFGFTYAAAAVVLDLIAFSQRQLMRTAVGLGTTPSVGNQTRFEAIVSLRELPLEMVIDDISRALPWGAVFYLFFERSLVPIVLNVGTSLAILYSVRQRKAWPFGAAILCYMIVTIVRTSGSAMFAQRALMELVRSSEFLSYIFSFIGGRGAQIFLQSTVLWPAVLAILPSLALALYIRRAFIRNQEEHS